MPESPTIDRPSGGFHVVFVGNDAGYFQSHRLPLALALIDAGYRVSAVLPAESQFLLDDRLATSGIDIQHYPLKRSGMNPFSEWRSLWALNRLIKQLAPDIVHHLTLKPALYGGVMARIRRVPVRIHALLGLGHLFFSDQFKARLIRWLLIPLFRFALGGRRSRILVQNRDDLETLARMGAIGPATRRRARIIPGSGVDPDAFTPEVAPGEPPIVLFAGRLTVAKGLRDFVEAARIARGHETNARFVVCGSIDQSNPDHISESLMESWIADGIIEWWGLRADMPDVLAESSLIVLPSHFGEGIPKILIEAAAAGRAVITTDTPGCRDIVIDKQNGLLVPAGDSDALASAMLALLSDPKLRSRMGEAGRAHMLSGFTVETVIQKTLDAYSESLAEAFGAR